MIIIRIIRLWLTERKLARAHRLGIMYERLITECENELRAQGVIR